jgi:tRNA dimethylallyltransferase
VLRMVDGELSEAEAVRLTVQSTRRFVRRQRSWFRRDPAVHWVNPQATDVVARALELVRSR